MSNEFEDNSVDSTTNGAGSGILEFPKVVHIYHHYDRDKPDANTDDESSEKTVKTAGAPALSPISQTMSAIRDLFQKVAVPQSREEGESEGEPENKQEEEEWYDNGVPMPPPPRKLWKGVDGFLIMLFGVAAPLLITALTILACPKRITLLLINHPCETLIEILMVLFIPFAVYRAWSALCLSDHRFGPSRGLLMGMGIATGLASFGISMAALFTRCAEFSDATGTDFSTGFFTIGMLSLFACFTLIYLARRVRANLDFASSRLRVAVYVACGVVLGLLSLAASECRTWCVRVAETGALSEVASERSDSLDMLRRLDTEKELRLETADARSVGLAGFFMPIKQSDVQRLYFTVTGKPFTGESDSDYSAMSDDYLRRHVVGAPVKGLSLVRSAINGTISPNSLSSTVSWTYVFRNESSIDQEARAEIALPPGAAVSKLTVWKDGEPLDASFAASGKAVGGSSSTSYTSVGHENPAIMTDLGRGRYLFHCFPVREGSELRVQLKAALPLKLDGVDKANLVLPRFIATNFDLDGEHALRLESRDRLTSLKSNLKESRSSIGRFVLEGSLPPSQIEHSPLLISARRDATIARVTAFDEQATVMAVEDAREAAEARKRALAEQEREENADNQKVVVMIDGSHGVKQQLEDVESMIARKKRARRQAAPRPETVEPIWAVRDIEEVTSKNAKRVLVVIDGSSSVRPELDKIKSALAAAPQSVPVSVMVASQEQTALSEPTPVKQALSLLSDVSFVGGQSNLKAVVKAAEVAGQSQGGVVLWIHGAQPALFPDIFIMDPFVSKPALFELSLDSGETDTLEYFKNHTEIASFNPVYQQSDLTATLGQFLARFQPGVRDFETDYRLSDGKPRDMVELEGTEQEELCLLSARRTVDRLIKERNYSEAARVAVRYQIVSPVTCVAVLDDSSIVQSATNGTIGADGTVVMGVNTAGTVRVNNIANLEALLNIVANLAEIAGLFVGAVLFLHGLMVKESNFKILGVTVQLTPFTRAGIGVVIALLALSTPGLINWFVASARDANLFS
ncbi:MAG: hypothetical protein AB7V06_25940 [Candidatus Obscuribacterales bacterium]